MVRLPEVCRDREQPPRTRLIAGLRDVGSDLGVQRPQTRTLLGDVVRDVGAQLPVAARHPLELSEQHVRGRAIGSDALKLGVNGVCVISHGSSNATAIVNAVRVARDSVAAGTVDRLTEAIGTS